MPLTLLVFLGSIRDSTPPRPARLGLRVARACVARLTADGHEAVLIDPLDIDLSGSFKPHFSYAKGKAPEALEDLARKIAAADGYVMVSPEYNHSMSPALAHLLNHFGSSLYSYKPSAIVTYSAGPMGRGTGCGEHAYVSGGVGLSAGFGDDPHPQGAGRAQ